MNSTGTFAVRRLLPGEEELYRTIRLEALQQHPGNFGNSHAKEAAFPPEYWAERLRNPDKATFGLYADGSLIGLTAILRREEDPQEAYLTQSYIRLPWRGKGLSRLLYEARLAWARERGIRRLVITHRRSNAASGAANQRFGFRFTHAEPRVWPDGVREDNLFYKLEL